MAMREGASVAFGENSIRDSANGAIFAQPRKGQQKKEKKCDDLKRENVVRPCAEMIDETGSRWWVGEEAEVPLMAEKDLKVVLPRAQMQGITMKVNYTMPIEAPVKKGDAIAKLKVEIPGQEPVEMNMLAARDVARLGIFGRVKARLSYLISGNE